MTAEQVTLEYGTPRRWNGSGQIEPLSSMTSSQRPPVWMQETLPHYRRDRDAELDARATR